MIAKVKLAPMEHWCEEAKARFSGNESPENLTMGILPHTMKQSQWCDGRVWQHDSASVNEAREKVGLEPVENPRWACEHMLEMD